MPATILQWLAADGPDCEKKHQLTTLKRAVISTTADTRTVINTALNST